MNKKIQSLLEKGSKSKMPSKIAPMLCVLTKSVTTDERYVHEIKIDGYRIIAYLDRGKVRLDSRSGLDYTKYYPAIVNFLKKINYNLVIDGELCAVDDAGRPDFDALQANLPGTVLTYFVFDLLWFNGINLMGLSLIERKAILKNTFSRNKNIVYSAHFEDGEALFTEMKERGMEGIVSKRKDSPYVPGLRKKDWLKTPTERRQEFVIAGWVESEARDFRTLLFGAYKGKDLYWVGHAGGGFKHKEMSDILKKLKRLEINKSPFVNEVDYDGTPHWTRPVLVANFKFSGFTKGGRIRKPAVFLGFRNDKPAKEVVIEKAQSAKSLKKTGDNLTTGRRRAVRTKATPGSNWPKIESVKIQNEETFHLPNCDITVTNIHRELWKGVAKAHLLQYYHAVAPYILPYLKDRPQSLHIKAINANAPGFYIKDMEGREPECATIFRDKRKHRKEGARDVIDYLVVNNVETLLFMINLGCIDVNPWNSRTFTPNQPDYIVIDLDPSDNKFSKAIEAARAAKEYFSETKLKAFIKTSGKSGLHIYVPCAGLNFTHARTIAEAICNELHTRLPAITTTAVSINQRGNKLYLDPNQNDYADTVAAAYSARPNHTPTVSTPLEWKEVNNQLDPSDFTIHNIGTRLKRKGDLFKGALDKATANRNSKLLKQLF